MAVLLTAPRLVEGPTVDSPHDDDAQVVRVLCCGSLKEECFHWTHLEVVAEGD